VKAAADATRAVEFITGEKPEDVMDEQHLEEPKQGRKYVGKSKKKSAARRKRGASRRRAA
jgi:hypothetical protein